ncbi:hypothetical protein [Streptomyces rimosus]
MVLVVFAVLLVPGAVGGGGARVLVRWLLLAVRVGLVLRSRLVVGLGVRGLLLVRVGLVRLCVGSLLLVRAGLVGLLVGARLVGLLVRVRLRLGVGVLLLVRVVRLRLRLRLRLRVVLVLGLVLRVLLVLGVGLWLGLGVGVLLLGGLGLGLGGVVWVAVGVEGEVPDAVCGGVDGLLADFAGLAVDPDDAAVVVDGVEDVGAAA